ncbi:MAG: sensor histidine kinase [Flavobacteriaceae bacterium]
MNKTYKFGLKTALLLSVFLAVILCILSYAYLGQIRIKFIVISTVSFFVFAFLLIQFRVENFIYKRLKEIVNKVSVLDIKDVDQNSVSTDLSSISNELEQVAEQNRLEIISLNQQEVYRREFLGNVAHEMKTPIFTIQGYLITLLEGAGEDEELRQKYLERAVKGVDRLEAIVKDLDMIAKLETKDIHPVFENFNLVALIQNVFDILELKASKKGSILRFEEYYQFPIIVNADREKIEQVLINLIENSIKYGRNEGVTNVRIDTQTNGHVTICVSDDGEGINEAYVNRIFERFYRVEKSRSRDQGGSGLGLSIVKHILEAHKQQITVKSEIGKGTTFCFTLDKGI